MLLRICSVSLGTRRDSLEKRDEGGNTALLCLILGAAFRKVKKEEAKSSQKVFA